MTTTHIFVELLIIGLGVAIWLALLGFTILGRSPGNALELVDSLWVPILGGIAYVLGIVVDRFSRRLLWFVERGVKAGVFANIDFPNPDDIERYILTTSEPLARQIYYNRSRLRICRAWTLNLILIVFLFIAWSLRAHSLGMWELAAVGVAGIVVIFLTAWATRYLARDHYNNLRASYLFLTRGIADSTEVPARNRL